LPPFGETETRLRGFASPRPQIYLQSPGFLRDHWTTDELSLTRAECGRKPRDDENTAEEWRAFLDIDDDLPVFCPECAEREFGED
jgi:hypothetical protein